MKNINVKAVWILIVPLLISCSSADFKEWQLESVVGLEGIGIVGLELSEQEDFFWISDGNNNMLLKSSMDGEIIEQVEVMSRPMHLSLRDGSLYVAEYGADRIIRVDGEHLISVPLPQAPDAPSGVDTDGERVAVADFYNHRIIIWNDLEDLTFGNEGNGPGQFHYPTQVRFYNENLYVADAYNHRIQVFDKGLDFIKSIGEGDGMNATTGLFVDGSGIYATDFENSRLLIYNHRGELMQIISENLDNPTAVIHRDGKLYVANFRGEFISIYRL